MSAEEGTNILNFWYPVLFSKDLPTTKPYPLTLWGEPMVLFRDKEGKIQCLQDRCSHRGTPLSIGYLRDGHVECRYHGWQFGTNGTCIAIPSLPDGRVPSHSAADVTSYPATEREEIIWVWPGDPTKASEDQLPPDSPEFVQTSTWKRSDVAVDVDNAPYWCFIENSVDPAHLQFTHEGRQGKSIGPIGTIRPIEVEVTELSSPKDAFKGYGSWTNSDDPRASFTVYFFPPVTVRLEVMARKGDPIGTTPPYSSFHSMSYFIPLGKNKTRVLLRTFRNFVKWLPESSWTKGTLKIFNQDIAVLTAQSLRLAQGSHSWNLPVKGDMISLRYRRWRDKVELPSKPYFKKYNGRNNGPDAIIRANEQDIEEVPLCFSCPNYFSNCRSQSEVIQTINSQLAPQLWDSEAQTASKTRSTLTTFLYVSLAILAVSFSVRFFLY